MSTPYGRSQEASTWLLRPSKSPPPSTGPLLWGRLAVFPKPGHCGRSHPLSGSQPVPLRAFLEAPAGTCGERLVGLTTCTDREDTPGVGVAGATKAPEPWTRPQIRLSQALQPWATYFCSLLLRFLIWRMGIEQWCWGLKRCLSSLCLAQRCPSCPSSCILTPLAPARPAPSL